MQEMYVIKRTGELVLFDESRISNAIQKAIRAIGTKIPSETVDNIVSNIVAEINDRFVDFYPNVENIQDLVEKHLVKNGLYEVSKEYILYRAERKKARDEKRKQDIEKSLLGKLKLKKRDGSTVIFDPAKLERTLLRASSGLDISVSLITAEVINNIFDGISTKELEQALILAATAFIEKDPAYNSVAGRLFLQRVYKEVFGLSTQDPELQGAYTTAFKKTIREGIAQNRLDPKMNEFNLDTLAKAIVIDRDNLLQYIGIQTLYERYFLRWDNQRRETPQIFWMRVAMGLALNEKAKEEKAIEFYNVLSTLRFVSSTPTLFHSGTTHPQLSSCYLTTVMDDLKHIFKCLGDNAQLSKWSGGLGNDWTNIRATGSWIKATNVESQGVVPFLKIANDVTAAINRSGKRRGATCAYLEAWHMDIEDFLDLRKNTGDERRRTHDMNTAHWIPDLFMKRVLANEDWTLFSPDDVPDLHHIYGKKFEERYTEYEQKAKQGVIRHFKVIPAIKLWRKMLSMLFETGHPWITFKDPCNIRSPQDHVGVIHSSNLCTEITLNTSADETAVCNLGSINLEKHVTEKGIDEALLASTVHTAITMLDNVIDINFYPTVEAENSNKKHRPIGLGIMGVQDALFRLNLPFDAEEAFEFSDRIMELISYHAIAASSNLAKEKGSYESFKGSKWDRGIFPLDTLDILEQERGMEIPISRKSTLDWASLKKKVRMQGMRNSNTMAVAPTATISTIAGCYPCIEPMYKNIYVKSNMSGEFTIINSYLIDDLRKMGLWNDEMLEQLKYYDGNISMIAAIPDELKAKYKESFDIDPLALIKHTALRGKWIDQSQSHNVFIKGTSGRVLSDAYQYAWQLGMKTTYYMRALAATQIEKSTLDANKYGYTQKREYKQGLEESKVCEACQ